MSTRHGAGANRGTKTKPWLPPAHGGSQGLRRGWTQAELASRIGTSRQWVISFERGKSVAEVGLVLKALAALGVAADIVPAPSAAGLVDLDELLGGT